MSICVLLMDFGLRGLGFFYLMKVILGNKMGKLDEMFFFKEIKIVFFNKE